MKKLKKVTLICLIASILLPACNSSLTITKRQHSKGYFVSTNKFKKNKTNFTESKIGEIEVQELRLKSVSIIEENSNIENKQIEYLALDSPQVGITKHENKTKTQSASRYTNSFGQKIEAKSSNLKLIQKKSKIQKKMRASSGDDALSLLWILILVLFILWLLGFITGGFGLGSIIHILLLIALILLILWLLKIL